jgi:DNA-binding CsgD family transcriptional regulator
MISAQRASRSGEGSLMSISSVVRVADVRAVFRLLNEIQAMSSQPGSWEAHMVDGLCRLVHADQGASIVLDGFGPTGDIGAVSFAASSHWMNPKAIEQWTSAMGPLRWRDDPLVDRSTKLRPAVAHTVLRPELMPDAEWHHASNPHLELARAADIGSHLIMFHRLDRPSRVRGVTLHRSQSDKPFSQRQRDTLHLFNLELCRLYRQRKLPGIDGPDLSMLSARQRQVLSHLLAGDTERQAAEALGISVHTANDHVKAIYKRLGVSSRAALMARFVRGVGQR